MELGTDRAIGHRVLFSTAKETAAATMVGSSRSSGVA